MAYAEKKDHWRDAAVAGVYDERRFRGRLGRVKHARDARLVLGLLERAGGLSSVLDLPAGTGRLLPDLAAAGYRVLGADLAREMLAAGRERRGAAALLLQADGERLPLADGAVDAVVSVRFLFHVDERESRAAILREMARVARRCVVGEVRFGGTWKHVSRTLRRHDKLRPAFDRAALADELAAAGLTLARIAPVSRLFSDKAFFLALHR
ncbi:MAG: class I SAM-dependent methyltransferase [Planctomycetota bacterium]